MQSLDRYSSKEGDNPEIIQTQNKNKKHEVYKHYIVTCQGRIIRTKYIKYSDSNLNIGV